MTDFLNSNIQLFKGDCIKRMKDIPDKSIDFILTDPPYNKTQCKWDIIIPFKEMWEQINRVIKDNGAIVLFGSQPFTSLLVTSNLKMFRYEIIWQKERPTNIFFLKKQIAKYHENILVFYKKQPIYNPQMEKRKGNHTFLEREYDLTKCNNNGSKTHLNQKYKYSKEYNPQLIYPKSVIQINRDRQKNAHPTQKPVSLGRWLIKTYTNPGDMVLDFTMGGGSFGVSALLEGRKFIGIEKDESYFEMAKNRITLLLNKQSL